MSTGAAHDPVHDPMQDPVHDPVHDPRHDPTYDEEHTMPEQTTVMHEPAPGAAPERPGLWAAGRHPVNTGHLVMGLAFLGMVGIWALLAGGVADAEDLGWLSPLPWLLAGAGGLVASTLSGAARRDRWRD